MQVYLRIKNCASSWLFTRINPQSLFFLNHLKSTGNLTYNKVQHSEILHCNHIEFVCFIWISEQTTNFALHNTKSSVFITDVESVYCGVRTGSLNKAGCDSS